MLVAGRGMEGWKLGLIIPYVHFSHGNQTYYVYWSVNEETMVVGRTEDVHSCINRRTSHDDRRLERLNMALTKAAQREAQYAKYFNGRRIIDVHDRVRTVSVRLSSLPDLGYIFSQPLPVLEKIISGKLPLFTDGIRCKIGWDDHEASMLRLQGWDEITIAK